jgi:hypothetical protein
MEIAFVIETLIVCLITLCLFRYMKIENHMWVHLCHEIAIVIIANYAYFYEDTNMTILTHSLLVGVYMVAIFYESGMHIIHHGIAIVLFVASQLWLTPRLQLLWCFLLNIEISTIFLSIKYLIKNKSIQVGPWGDMINNMLFAITFLTLRPIWLTLMTLMKYPLLQEDSPETWKEILIIVSGLLIIQYCWSYLVIQKVKEILKTL